jgi:type VI secretion system protein ImpM
VSTTAAEVTGWHGKLPSLADFATRRLDGDFVETWDAWLSTGLAALRSREGWLDDYLASPSWRFVLSRAALPGRLGETSWVGVLMPSIDRAGRYYPFTLAHPLAELPCDAAQIDELWRWLHRLDDVAIDALADDWTVDALEDALVRIGVLPTAAPPPPLDLDDGVQAYPLGPSRDPVAVLASQAAACWHERMRGMAWWFSDAENGVPCLLSSHGLSSAGLMARLFGGAVREGEHG